MNRPIGTCSNCGGAVVMPSMMVNPVPACERCGATPIHAHGPMIAMGPPIRARPIVPFIFDVRELDRVFPGRRSEMLAQPADERARGFAGSMIPDRSICTVESSSRRADTSPACGSPAG